MVEVPGHDIRESLLTAVVEDKLDLHGDTQAEAAVRLRSFIETRARTMSGKAVRVVTGKGNRSAGPPVLKPMVEEMLTGELGRSVEEWRVAPDAGSYLVRLK